MKFFNRDGGGRFSNYPKRLNGWAQRSVKRMGVASLYIGSSAVLIGIGMYQSQPITAVNIVEAEAVKVDTLAVKLEGMKENVLDKLMKCESKNFKDDDGLITIDNNKAGTLKGDDILSYGRYQWKTKTVKQFVMMRDAKAITSKEAKMLALDTPKARELAKYAIFDTTGGIFHWENCAASEGLVKEVEFIKKLTK